MSDPGTTSVSVSVEWLGRHGPLGLRRSAIVAAPLVFMLIVAGGVGARAMMEPPAPAIVQPAAAPAKVVTAPVSPPSVAPATPPARAVRPVARAERKLEKPAAPAAVQQTGKVEISVTPWGEILIDGKRRGISPPLRELEISAGAHTIEIRNATFQPHLQRVDVKAGQTTTIRHRFR